MTLESNTNQNLSCNINQSNTSPEKTEKILCPHCKRTATNGIKCKGICVADNDY